MTSSQVAQEPCTIGQPHPECRYANGGFRLDPAEWHCAREAAQEKPTSPRTVQRVYCESEWHEGKCPHCGREAAAATPSLDVRGPQAIEALDRIQRAVLLMGRVAADGTLVTESVVVDEAREALRDFHAAGLDEGSATPDQEER